MNLEIPENLLHLIEKFEKSDRQALKLSKLKSDFVEPFFNILGWEKNLSNSQFAIEPDVRELNKINKTYPDYLFKTAGNNHFYLKIANAEDKNFESSPEFFVLHQNCWTCNIPVGIVTDFNSINIYNLNSKPGLKVKRIFKCNFNDYHLDWDRIIKYVSKSSVQQGALQKYQKETLNTVYYYLANKLLDWYYLLNENIKSTFPDIPESEVKLTSIRLINRLILLRYCESLGLEPVNQLRNVLDNENIYKTLLHIFEKANDKYNSGLFYFIKESSRNIEALDLITFNIDIDRKILVKIISQLYADEIPLDFCIIPIDIIATAYDIFIKHSLEDSNGRMITKDYLKNFSAYEKNVLIDLIIKESLTEYLEGKKPGKRSSTSAIKILDPCCGAGLYLLKSYEFLINWNLEEYLKINDSLDNSGKLPIKKVKDGHWQLSWDEKKQILVNNIFGVDISRIAVESTELIILLKLLEDINPENIQNQLKLFWQHALPDLSDNIKCGNALIEPDIYKIQQFVTINEQQKSTINAFDWQDQFNIFNPLENFDIVVGHPPLFFSDFFLQKTKPYFKQRYAYFKDFKNSYLLFYEKSLKLLKKNGILAFIVPEEWLLNIESFNILRSFWIKNIYKLSSSSNNRNIPERLVTIIKKQETGESKVYLIQNLNFLTPAKSHHFKFINFLNINYFYGYFEKFRNSEINNKINNNSIELSQSAICFSGYNAYEKGKGLDPEGGVQTIETLKLKPYHSETRLNEQWKTEIVGRDISRYCLRFTGMRWIKYGPWLAAPRDPEIFAGERILLHERISITSGRIESSICSTEVFHGRDIIAIKPKNEFLSIYYLLGIINSKLFNWYYLVNFSAKPDEAFPKLLVANLNSSPIRQINQSDLKEKSNYQELIALVKRLLELNQKILEVSSERDKITIEKMIQNIDEEIDNLVYRIYNLSRPEIETIENGFNV